MKLTVTEINVETKEIIEREMTAEELADFEQRNKDFEMLSEKLKTEQALKESALAKLAAIGLTEEEIAAL